MEECLIYSINEKENEHRAIFYIKRKETCIMLPLRIQSSSLNSRLYEFLNLLKQDYMQSILFNQLPMYILEHCSQI